MNCRTCSNVYIDRFTGIHYCGISRVACKIKNPSELDSIMIPEDNNCHGYKTSWGN